MKDPKVRVWLALLCAVVFLLNAVSRIVSGHYAIGTLLLVCVLGYLYVAWDVSRRAKKNAVTEA